MELLRRRRAGPVACSAALWPRPPQGSQFRRTSLPRQHLGAIQWPLLAVRDVCGELQPRAEEQAAASIHAR